MIKCTSYSSMFSYIYNIKFINLYNFSNDKIISQIFNYKNDFYVCQKNKIIINPNAYNCCDFNFETNKCNSNIILNNDYSLKTDSWESDNSININTDVIISKKSSKKLSLKPF